jgi:hypothetical protein
MTITVTKTPKDWQPVYNPIDLVADSNASGLESYLTKLNVNGNHVADFYDAPRPDGKLWRDLHRAIEPFLKPDTSLITAQAATAMVDNTYMADYSFTIAEVVSGVSGSPTSLIEKGAHGMALGWPDFVGSKYDDFIIGNANRRFLTNRNNIRLYGGEKYEIGFLNTYSPQIDCKIIRIDYPYSGSPSTSTIAFAGSKPSKSIMFEFNAANFKTTFQVQDTATNDPLSEILTFNHNTECVTGYKIQLYYLNRLGRFDSYTFTAKHSTELAATKKEFNRIVGNLGVYSPYEGRIRQHEVKYENRMTLRSQWLTDDESNDMGEIITSPMAFALIDGILHPVNIFTNDFEIKYVSRNRLFAGEIQIGFAFDNYTQRL